MQTKSLIRKWLVLTIVVLFVGTSITVLGESSEAIVTKTKATIRLHDCSRDQVELRYYDPSTLSNVVGVSCPMPCVWKDAIRLTQTELAPYSTWTLTKVVIGFGEDPNEGPMNVTIFIYDMGNSTRPGNVIVDDTWAILNGTALITVPLFTPVALAGHTELWVAVQWTQHVDGTHYAFVDSGPAIVGKGDWIYLNDDIWQEIHSSLDANWALGAVVESPELATLVIGNITGPIGIRAEVQNIGDIDAYNVSWSIFVAGGFLNRVDETATGIDATLVAHGTIPISVPLFIGFGKIIIDIKAHATNADEVYAIKSAFLLGPFLFGIK